MTSQTECLNDDGRESANMKTYKPLHGRWVKLDDKAIASAIKKYEQGMSLAQIAPLFGISRQSLWGSFVRLGVPLRSQKRYGTDNHFYRGGKKATDQAHNKIEKAVLRNRIERPDTCEQCGVKPPPFKDGRTAIQGHHHDYSKPLEVRWLCQDCHHLEHKLLSKG
jgi:hypothetical protein